MCVFFHLKIAGSSKKKKREYTIDTALITLQQERSKSNYPLDRVKLGDGRGEGWIFKRAS